MVTAPPLPRYLDNVVNKQTVSPPIPHLHALLTSGDQPPPEIDVFELVKASYEVRRSEERRVGKECLRLCRSRWSPYH